MILISGGGSGHPTTYQSHMSSISHLLNASYSQSYSNLYSHGGSRGPSQMLFSHSSGTGSGGRSDAPVDPSSPSMHPPSRTGSSTDRPSVGSSCTAPEGQNRHQYSRHQLQQHMQQPYHHQQYQQVKSDDEDVEL